MLSLKGDLLGAEQSYGTSLEWAPYQRKIWGTARRQ